MSAIDIYSGTFDGYEDEDISFHGWEWRYVSLDEVAGLHDYAGKISTYPYCCGYAIYVNVFSDEIEKVTEFIHKTLEENKIRAHGFGSVQCTVSYKKLLNELINLGWKLINEHLNYGSGNTIYTLKYEL